MYNLKQGEKTTANIFEAYVAGVFYSFLESPLTTNPRLPKRPLSPNGSGSADQGKGTRSTASDKLTRGDAWDYLETWLHPLFIPIAEWALEQLRAEQAKLDELVAEKGGDADLDENAVGAMARLNEHCAIRERGKPDYQAHRAAGDMWTVVCVTTLRDGAELCVIPDSATHMQRHADEARDEGAKREPGARRRARVRWRLIRCVRSSGSSRAISTAV